MKAKYWLLISLLQGAASNAYAFKIGTHVWVAQEVINNIRKCEQNYLKSCVVVPNGVGEQVISIPNDVKAAVLEYPAYFRSGNIGPDAFPDILVGQTIIHPGITKVGSGGFPEASGFGTSDWLNHLLNRARQIDDTIERKKALAFVFGFLGHAAADTFAHTYVNTYAGDVFSLSDGESIVEQRHIALEDYIQSKTPELSNENEVLIGDAASQLKDGVNLAIPVEFIRLNLIFDKVAHAQYAVAGPTAAHMLAVVDLHGEIGRALATVPSGMSNTEYAKSIGKSFLQNYYNESYNRERTAEDVLAMAKKKYEDDYPQGGSLQQAETVAIQVLAYYYFNLELNQQQAAKTAEILNGFMVYQSKAVGEWDSKRSDIDQKALQIYSRASAAGVALNDDIAKARTKFGNSLTRFHNASESVKQAARNQEQAKSNLAAKQAVALCSIVSQASCERVKSVVKSVPYGCQSCKKKFRGKCILWVPDTCYKDISELITSLDPSCMAERSHCSNAHTAHNQGLAALRSALTGADQKLNLAKNTLSAEEKLAKAEFAALQSLLVSTQTSVEKNYQTLKTLESRLVEVSRALSEGHREIITEWHRDIEEAMRQYVVANGQAIINSFDGDNETSTLAPLRDWVTCYLPSIIGVMQEVLNLTTCASQDIKAQYDVLFAKIEVEIRKIDPQVAGRFLEYRDRFKESLAFKIAASAGRFFNDLTKNKKYDAEMTAHIMMNEISRTNLNQIFAEDHSSKNLLRFSESGGSIADRVDVDMGVVGGETFSREKFSTVANAITFASLALANNAGINQLGEQGLVNHHLDSTALSNLLTKSLRSIDGNHQWMELAPPFPRAGSVANDSQWISSRNILTNIARRFSVPRQGGIMEPGFPLFYVKNLRTAVFERVFKGPLNKGLFESEKYNFENLLPSDYSYRPTEDVPFPYLSH